MSVHSWKKIDENSIKKTTDVSFFEHRGSGLPIDVRNFFLMNELQNGEKQDIELIFKGESYFAYIIKDSSDTSRTRIFWSGGLKNVLDAYYDNTHFPDVYFIKKGEHSFELTFELPKVQQTQHPDVMSSPLYKVLSRLSIASKEMIASGNQDLDDFNLYLHVKKPIENLLMAKIDEALMRDGNQLVLIVGSVGDGKSHLLSYFKRMYPEKMSQFYIHNDATESYEPTKDSIETLKEYVFDKLVHNENQKIILAINLGVLYNFITRYGDEVPEFKSYIEKTEIFEKNHNDSIVSKHYQVVSFTDYKMFELTKEGPQSFFITELLDKIISIDENNPFYHAYKETYLEFSDSFLVRNFELLMNNNFIKDNLIQLIIRALIENKLMLSTRDLLDFFYVVLTNTNSIENTLFEENNLDSKLLHYIQQYDPLLDRNLQDEITFVQRMKIQKEHISKVKDEYRLQKLKSEQMICNQTYLDYVKVLYEYYSKKSVRLYQFSQLTMECIRLWNGQAGTNKIFIDSNVNPYRIAIHFDIMPLQKFGTNTEVDIVEKFDYSFNLYFKVLQDDFILGIDAQLFSLIEKMSNYYRPTKIDREAAISFTEVVDKMTDVLNKSAKTITLVNKHDDSEIVLTSGWGPISIN